MLSVCILTHSLLTKDNFSLAPF